MAVRFDAAGDRATYSGANPPAPSSGLTITAWVSISADQNDEATWIRLWATTNTTVVTWATNSDGTGGPNYFTASGTVSLTTGFVVGEWRKVAITCSGTTGHVYAALPGGATSHASGTVGVGTPNGITIGGRNSSDANEWFNGKVAYVRVWSAELTQTEIEAEWASTTPVRATNLWADWPLTNATELTDTVAGRTLVPLTGPVVTEEGPPIAPGAAPDSVFDLSNWHLTTPAADPSDGNADQIDQPALATYASEWFYLDSLNRMVCIAPVNGATTSGESGATRTELRQHEKGSYTSTAFDPNTTGRRQITLTTRADPTSITGGTLPRQELIIFQIHGASGTPPIYLTAEWTSSGTPVTPRIRMFLSGSGLSNTNVVSNITTTTDISIRLRVESATVKLWVVAGTVADLPPVSSTPHYSWAASAFTDQSSWYFKAGGYNKSAIDAATTGAGKATISYLQVLDPGDSEPAETSTSAALLPFLADA